MAQQSQLMLYAHRTDKTIARVCLNGGKAWHRVRLHTLRDGLLNVSRARTLAIGGNYEGKRVIWARCWALWGFDGWGG